MTTVNRRPCRLCGDNDYTPVYYLDEVEIARCGGCGFIQISSAHSIEDLLDHYAQPTGDGGATRSEFDREKIVRASRFRADYFQKYTGLKSGSILEVGSSEGHFLHELKIRGFSVTGVEPSPLSALAREKGIPVHNDILENVDLPDASFDAVCMIQVVEHFEEPREVLALARSKLKKGGVIVIETPDIFSVGSRFEKTPYKLFNKEHVSYFSPENLSGLVESMGFSTVAVGHCDYDGLRLPFAKMLKRVVVPMINPGFKGPLEKILGGEIEIRHSFQKAVCAPPAPLAPPSTLEGTGAAPSRRGLKDIRKCLSAPLDLLFSYIAFLLDRGASFYAIYRKN
jgi:SAM-dependent methyltransferase